MTFCSRIARPFTNMLVISRCFSTIPKTGKYSRDIANYEKEIVKLKELRAKCLKKRDNVENSKTKRKLTERDLSFLKNKVDAKYVRLTFNLLSKINQLDFLYMSEEQIYPGQDFEVDPIIETVRNEYENESKGFTFRKIVRYLKQLSKGDLSKLKRFYYSKQVEKIHSEMDTNKNLIQDKKIDLAICKKLAKKKVCDFKEGNFGFITNKWDQKNLKIAYKIFQKINGWKIFINAPKALNYLTWDDPTYMEFKKELVKHDIPKGYIESISKQLKHIHDKGWEKFVASYLDAARKDLGIDIMESKIPTEDYKRTLDYI